MSVESSRLSGTHGVGSIAVRMLGPLTIWRDDVAAALPGSRKMRALFACLALAPHALPRSQLCDLLWDVPNDPRGELRWCLSKIRGLIDEPDRHRVHTQADSVRLDLSDCFVDAIEVAKATDGIDALSVNELRAQAMLFGGDFLEGLETERSPAFSGWLAAQRRRFRRLHAALLERLVTVGPEEDRLGYLGTWLELAPFDPAVHARLFRVLAERGQLREGEEHLAATLQLFEAEGLDVAQIRAAWQHARTAFGAQSPMRLVDPVAAATGHVSDAAVTPAPRRASIAVMPFIDRSIESFGGAMAQALSHDVIIRLAKLRSLFVIAHGTVLALHDRHIGPEEAARMLHVDYVVNGVVQRQGERILVSVELAETRGARIIWADTLDQRQDDALLVLDEIGDRIVASVAIEIETVERNRAVLKPPNSLDAWEAYHRGLWHMYRFNKPDNELAQHFFRMAVRMDPTFSRAHAGLSFTHWQNAFQNWATREQEMNRAYEAAGQSLMADDRDPSAHLAMGRALWLQGGFEQSMRELDRAVDLSPNFAMGHYSLGFVHSQAGDPNTAILATDHARNLSPFDPMLFGMLGARAMALVRVGWFDDAAACAVRGAARPNTHVHILAIAAFSLALAGRVEDGRCYLATIHQTVPRYRIDDFLAAMQFMPDGERVFRDAAGKLGLP